jgi:MRC1-like domain
MNDSCKCLFHREQAEEADQKLEKIHMAVVQGEHRKRQRGVGVDDSDEESEDGDNSKARRAMKKLKMIERGDIKDLGMSFLCGSFSGLSGGSRRKRGNASFRGYIQANTPG